MYGTCIYLPTFIPKTTPNAGNYTIHGSYGYCGTKNGGVFLLRWFFLFSWGEFPGSGGGRRPSGRPRRPATCSPCLAFCWSALRFWPTVGDPGQVKTTHFLFDVCWNHFYTIHQTGIFTYISHQNQPKCRYIFNIQSSHGILCVWFLTNFWRFFFEQKPDQECHQHHMKKVWGLM